MSRILSRDEFSELAKAGASVEGQIRKEYVASSSVDVEKRTVKFVISTGDVDRDNDMVDPKGWHLEDYKKSPVVLWAHDHECPPIAKAVSVSHGAKGLVSVAQFPEKGIYPFADMIFELVKGGFISAASVGFKPMEYKANEKRQGFDFSKQSLLEWSIVPVPANPNALMAASAAGVDLKPMQKWLGAVLESWPMDELPIEAKAISAVQKVAKRQDSDRVAALQDQVKSMSESLQVVLDRLDAMSQQKAESAQSQDDSDLYVELSDDPEIEKAEDLFDVDEAEIKAAFSSAIGASMREMAAEATRRAINEMRGRLD